ncbi:MAG: hypothetical protein M0R46_15645 [Candidatus Muirbacterium halophilum]|nr:hypothetical protein [Candidatus Muirbacterium halophilum]MCK9477349.1 hypothetical protein [Candidatus Muirbacterium halophilum]
MKKLFLILFLNIVLCTFSLNFSELRGIVLDSKNLEPVKNAKIFVEDEIKYTDMNGEFYVQALLSGANLVKVDKDSYSDYSKVVFLYKGHNSKKFIISKKYEEIQKTKIEKSEEVIIVNEKKDIVIEKSFPEIKPKEEFCETYKEQTDIVKEFDYCDEENYSIKSTYQDNSLNSIMSIINRLSGDILVKGEVVDKNTGVPVSDIPIFFDNKVIFTDNNGKFTVNTSKNNALISIDCKGYEKFNQKFKFDKTDNFIKLSVIKHGGAL